MRVTRVLVLCLAVLSIRGVAFAQLDPSERGWVDVNFGVAQPAEEALTTQFTPILFREQALFETTYNFSRGADFDFGGGFMLHRYFGLGVSIVGTAYKDPADLRISIPHPTLFNRSASDEGTTNSDLERTEGVVNIQAMVVPVNTDTLRVRFFGGPSYFRLRGDAITAIEYEQAFFFAANVVEITSFEAEEVEGTGWGYHAGGDVSVFFTRLLGVGGFARFSRGDVTVSDVRVVADEPVDVKVGGFQMGGGLRLRF